MSPKFFTEVMLLFRDAVAVGGGEGRGYLLAVRDVADNFQLTRGGKPRNYLLAVGTGYEIHIFPLCGFYSVIVGVP